MPRPLFAAAAFAAAAALLRADAPPAEPKNVTLEGRLVDIGAEMRARFKADKTDRAKEPLYGLKTGEGYHVILRTRDSERFWLDKRMRDRDLILNGRVFPDSRVLEVFTVQRRLNGKVLDVYYWCEICAIKAVTDDACACCQGEVELRETPAVKQPAIK